jgi:hypothetical protein
MADSLLIIEDEPLLGSELREEFAEAGWDAVLATDLVQAERGTRKGGSRGTSLRRPTDRCARGR